MLITDTNYIPTGVGPAESPRESGGGSSLDTHTINYSYDPLNRLTAASYSGSLTANYGYEYDTLGNRMTYTATLTNTVVTTYTYNLANRLQTAKSDDTTTTWYYVYDNNGSRLQQLPGGLTPAAGAVQYSYDQSRRLVQVESHDGTAFQLQAEMVYDGRGNRLQAIAYANGSTITASYTLDPRSGLPLRVDNGTTSTIILYGQAAIGEYTTQWRYYLGDAQLSVRQLVDAAGAVTQAQTYAPYGVLLNQAGDGGGLFGYKGGQSSTNGLWYFGNGYFDPNTGQFISANGDTASPLAAANAIGFFLAPVLFIGWRRRKGKKRIHPATMLFLGILLAATLSSCVEEGVEVTGTETAAPPDPTATPTPPPETTEPPPTGTPLPPTPNPTDEPIPTITPTPTPCPTPTQPPSPTPFPQSLWFSSPVRTNGILPDWVQWYGYTEFARDIYAYSNIDKIHAGLDFGVYFNEFQAYDPNVANSGIVIYAATSGIVRNTGADASGYGRVEITLSDGSIGYYDHLDRNNLQVNVGDPVDDNTPIGYLESEQAHLHLERRLLDNTVTNPLPFFASGIRNTIVNWVSTSSTRYDDKYEWNGGVWDEPLNQPDTSY